MRKLQMELIKTDQYLQVNGRRLNDKRYKETYAQETP